MVGADSSPIGQLTQSALAGRVSAQFPVFVDSGDRETDGIRADKKIAPKGARRFGGACMTQDKRGPVAGAGGR